MASERVLWVVEIEDKKFGLMVRADSAHDAYDKVKPDYPNNRVRVLGPAVYKHLA